MDVECIIGITRSGCAFGCGGNLFPVDDSQEALENFDARVRASTRGDQVRESSYHFCSWSNSGCNYRFSTTAYPRYFLCLPRLRRLERQCTMRKRGLTLASNFLELAKNAAPCTTAITLRNTTPVARSSAQLPMTLTRSAYVAVRRAHTFVGGSSTLQRFFTYRATCLCTLRLGSWPHMADTSKNARP